MDGTEPEPEPEPEPPEPQVDLIQRMAIEMEQLRRALGSQDEQLAALRHEMRASPRARRPDADDDGSGDEGRRRRFGCCGGRPAAGARRRRGAAQPEPEPESDASDEQQNQEQQEAERARRRRRFRRLEGRGLGRAGSAASLEARSPSPRAASDADQQLDTALGLRLQLARMRLAFASLAHGRLGAESEVHCALDIDVLTLVGRQVGRATEQRQASEELVAALKHAVNTAPPRDAVPVPAVWRAVDGAMSVGAAEGFVSRESFVGTLEDVTAHVRGGAVAMYVLDATMLRRVRQRHFLDLQRCPSR